MDMILPKQNCPLCDRVVEFVGIDFERNKKFNCPHCGIYRISLTAEEAVIKLSKQQREIISKASIQCDNKTTLFIWIDETTKEIRSRCEPEHNW